MKQRSAWIGAAAGCVCVLAFGARVPTAVGVEAIEIGPRNTADLPGGREADGIIGDFVLRNDVIEALVAGNQPGRKANMGVHWDATAQGTLFDLTFRGENNDQITWFGPGGQRGPVSSVRIVKDGSGGEAVVRAELTAAAGSGVGWTRDYVLRDGWQHVVVVTRYRNETGKPIKMGPAAAWIGLTFGFEADGIVTGLCQDPDDRVGYAKGGVAFDGAEPAAGEVEIGAGESRTFAQALAIGRGTAEAYGVIAGLRGAVQGFRGRVVDVDGEPAKSATVQLAKGDKSLVAYVGDDGAFSFAYPDASVDAVVLDIGRPAQKVKLAAGEPKTIEVPKASGVAVKVTDADGAPLPCKVQFIGVGDTATPYLGPVVRAHGCDNQYQSESGSFTQALPAGAYRMVITRGIEYDHVEREVTVPAGAVVEVTATLRRVLDTTGWISGDFHNHTTISGDNYCGTDDRIINLAAEDVEFAPTTEHNRIYDWEPHICKLGLRDRLKTVSGIELTGGGPHLNAFPLIPVLFSQDNGAPQWNPDPRINALVLRQMPGDRATRWVHLNHPNVPRYFAHLKPGAKPGDGFPHLESLIDAAELYGEDVATGTPIHEFEYHGKKRQRDNWPFVWMQMMNAGTRIWTIAVSDAHEVTRGGVGGWRTYIRSHTDEPGEIDPAEIIANAKAGKTFVTCGPFLEVAADDGAGPGDTIVNKRSVQLNVRVQCNTWVKVDRVLVLVNGRVVPGLDFRRAEYPAMFGKSPVCFEKAINVALDEDAYLIVVARGEHATLATGFGQSWQKALHPTAYHNPIFVDVDGDGFEPNGDTLGHGFLEKPN